LAKRITKRVESQHTHGNLLNTGHLARTTGPAESRRSRDTLRRPGGFWVNQILYPRTAVANASQVSSDQEVTLRWAILGSNQ
jgi:hypothetical protein